MNRKIIGKILGFLLVMESFLFMPPAFISWMDGERVALTAFFTAAAVAAVVGGWLSHTCKEAERSYYAREGFLIVSLGWIVLSAVGALPFWISKEIPQDRKSVV